MYKLFNLAILAMLNIQIVDNHSKAQCGSNIYGRLCTYIVTKWVQSSLSRWNNVHIQIKTHKLRLTDAASEFVFYIEDTVQQPS